MKSHPRLHRADRSFDDQTLRDREMLDQIAHLDQVRARERNTGAEAGSDVIVVFLCLHSTQQAILCFGATSSRAGFSRRQRSMTSRSAAQRAAFWLDEQVWRRSGDRFEAVVSASVDARQGGQQGKGVRMAWVFVEVINGSFFDDEARIHHQHPLCKSCDDTKVVGD